jgi:hypothetical protein
MSCVKCYELSIVSANTAVASFRVNMYVLVGHVWKPYTGQAVGGGWDVMNMIGGAEERAAIQLVISTWLRNSC